MLVAIMNTMETTSLGFLNVLDPSRCATTLSVFKGESPALAAVHGTRWGWPTPATEQEIKAFGSGWQLKGRGGQRSESYRCCRHRDPHPKVGETM